MNTRIAENYRDQMLSVRQAGEGAGDVAVMGGAVQVSSPVGAVKVAVYRDEVKILQKLKVLAAAAGERWYYRWTTNNRDGTKGVVEGPSIDCAMAVARLYGNCEVDVRVKDEGEAWLFYARFVDYESGFTLTRAFQQRKNQKTMKTDADRQLDIVFQIGTSKAQRNVVCKALADFTDYAFEEAKASFVDRIGSKLEFYRDKAVTRFHELNFDIRRVEAILGKAVKSWLAPDLARIIAELQAVMDGMASLDELYPAQKGEAPPAEEPRREPAKPAAPVEQPKDEPKAPAEQAAADKAPAAPSFDIEAYLEGAEARAEAATTVSALAELDAEVSEMIEQAGNDEELSRYWRGVVIKRQEGINIGDAPAAKESAAETAPAAEASAEPNPWDEVVNAAIAEFEKARLLTALTAACKEAIGRADEAGAPLAVRERIEAARAEREKAIKAARR